VIFNAEDGVLLLKLIEGETIGALALLDLEYFRVFVDDGAISGT